MRGGDISNEIAPRLWFVFEGLVVIPDGHDLEYIQRLWMKRRRPKLEQYFVVSPIVLRRMWDLTLGRFDFHCEVVTFFGEWHDQAVSWMTALDMPASVHYVSPEDFRDRTLSPAVARVYDPNPRRALVWGSKGVYIDPHHDFEPLQ